MNASFCSNQDAPKLNLNISLGEELKGGILSNSMNKTRTSIPQTVEGSFELASGYQQPSPTLPNLSSTNILPYELLHGQSSYFPKPIQRVKGSKISLK